MSAAPDATTLSPASLAESAAQPGFALLRDGSTWRLYRNPKQILAANDADSLVQSLRRIEDHITHGGEAAGLLRYEAGYALEQRLRPLLGEPAEPLAWFGLYADCAILENPPLLPDDKNIQIDRPRLEIARDKYCRKIEEIRRLIEAGEVYQINFTTRLQFEMQCGAWDLFCALCRRHPVPYAAFLNLGDEQIVSLSPELFFEIENGRIAVRPMKGTAPRGRTLDEDIAAGEALRIDEKNRAENVMIVDLMRNDLGRICRTGSVKTTKLFDVERYPSVWQMTSTVEGELKRDCTIESIARALFPSGSVTGAPKIRAMEHIAHLESSPRGAYTGAIGFFASQRSFFNVAIRTVTLRGSSGAMGVGGGITHGSSAPAEWEECQWKAAFLTESEPEFKLLETTLWDGEYRFLEDHLARMKNSAEYFGFRFDELKIRETLNDLAARFPRGPQRVRITLSRVGKLEIEHRDYVDERFGRVRISDRKTSSSDRFLFHKTTNRRIYDEEFVAARKAGFDDALFFNERGELTEGAIHNVFVVKDGVWKTPPVSYGLLPGTARAQILREQPSAREAILALDDLLGADEIYLCNSVRGVYAVELVLDDRVRPQHAEIDLRESAQRTVK
ncbi:MAG TPA: aminodeoxychorismate synthase component I [Candidatus Acidoferrales bacterium]|nr:aminodeoxychorismate synthase component I [Candidatus Acidoferrales bacterium]